jgi:hypothetical protein
MEFLSAHPVPTIFCTNVTILGDRPEYCLSPGTLARLAYFRIEYCIDIFDYSV